jgi:3-oxoacyl-(acyl-carrier-protein) synthase
MQAGMAERMMDNKRKAVITGIGIVSPAGIGHESHWRNVRADMNFVKDLQLDEEYWPFRYGGLVGNVELPTNCNVKIVRNLNRANRMAVLAAGLALKDAALEGRYNPEKSGVFF